MADLGTGNRRQSIFGGHPSAESRLNIPVSHPKDNDSAPVASLCIAKPI